MGSGDFSMGSGYISLGCGDWQVASGGQLSLGDGQVGSVLNMRNDGILDGGQSSFSLAGNWHNAGTFDAGTGTVTFVDGCGSASSSISGSSSFYNLAAVSSTGKPLVFPAGLTQRVSNSLDFQGTPGSLLPVRSNTPGSPARLSLSGSGSQSIGYVRVTDMHIPQAGQQLAGGAANLFNSVDGGGNLGWFLNTLASLSPQAVPALPVVALLAMVLAVGTLGSRAARRLRDLTLQ